MNVVTTTTEAIRNILSGASGVDSVLSDMLSPNSSSYPPCRFYAGNVPVDVLELSRAHYPLILVYCEKLENTQREKFASLSGIMHMAIELRISAARSQEVSDMTEKYLSAILESLQTSKGTLAKGVHQTGVYQVSFGPIKKGGTELIQTTKISLPIHIHIQ